MTLIGEGEQLLGVQFGMHPAGEKQETPLLREARQQMEAYFQNRLRSFELPLCLKGTAFQMRVWRELERIPWGEVRTYGDIARSIGCPKGFRAVGGANHHNQIPIIIPCHRVVAASGIGGYGGGVEIKRILLQLEGHTV